MTGACIQLNGYASKIGTEYGYQVKFVNGPAGGNLDVGITYSGQRGWARLRPETTVSGALGDIRFAGTIYSHAQMQSLGPLVDPMGNYCRHD
jgi:hypothetical protein